MRAAPWHPLRHDARGRGEEGRSQAVRAPRAVPWALAGTNHSIWRRLSHDRTRGATRARQGALGEGGPQSSGAPHPPHSCVRPSVRGLRAFAWSLDSPPPLQPAGRSAPAIQMAQICTASPASAPHDLLTHIEYAWKNLVVGLRGGATRRKNAPLVRYNVNKHIVV